MSLTKKMVSVVYNFLKKNEAKGFGSQVIEKLKGGITYKIYYELIGDNKYAKDPAYIKLIYPSKKEIIISPLPHMTQAFEESNQVGMIRYEFEKKVKGKTSYLYLMTVGDKVFDLPEDMAKTLSKKLDLKIKKG
jgi:hypothetical protein